MSEGTTTRLADICMVALAECFRDDGELLANPIGNGPMIGGRLARATFSPDMLMTDGEAQLIENTAPVGVADPPKVVAAWNPYRNMFNIVWGGRRHIIMGASQMDAFGNHNFSLIGDPAAPKSQLLGFRGAPGNTINNITSYFIPNHSPKVFVSTVDVVCGVGNDRAAALQPAQRRFHQLRHVVTNLCVFDFATEDGRMRLRSLHPGVTTEMVVAATSFDVVIPAEVPITRLPSDTELALLDEIDPNGLRYREVPDPETQTASA